jgi:phage terminase large subunit-like protein
MAKLTDEQLEQRRKASAAGAAAPHDTLCGCPQCFYRARKIAREGGQQDFLSRVDWAASQEAERAARAKVVDAARARVVEGEKGVVEQDMPAAPGSAIRVVQLEDKSRVFVAGEAGSADQQDQTSEADARAALWACDPAAWIDDNIKVSELGRPFKLADYQRRVLAKMFMFDQDGKLGIDEGVWSEPKKGGKTTLMAALGLWWGDTQESPNEILVVANDLEQASSRAFATMVQLLARNPELGARAKRTSNTMIKFATGTTIKAIASEYAGAAGSNHGLVLYDETWAGTSENYRRLVDELTPVPTRLNSIRLIFSYAGYEGESKTLQQLYFAGVDTAEHPEGRGVRIDDELPIYSSKEGAGLNLVTFWSHECRQPWQTKAWLERQRQDHIAKGRVSTWLRLFENRWVSGESLFITAEMWDACVDQSLAPAIPSKAGARVYAGIDIGIKSDTSAIVAIKKVRGPDGLDRIQLVNHKIWTPKPGTPVNHADIAAYLRWLHRSFNVAAFPIDPNQALEMIAYLTREGLPMVETPQTAGTVDAMGQALITAVQSRQLQVYPDDQLRQQALNVVAVEMPSGMMRMSKAKSGRKIDAMVALALAIRQLAVVPESFHIPSWSYTVTTAEKARGAGMGRIRENGFIEGSGGKFLSKSGEIYYDPRYS